MNASRLRSATDVLKRQLAEPEVRAQWDRTALARAVARRLIQYRADHNLSQTRLAKMLDMQQPAVARLESGEHPPSIETLVRLSDILSMEVLIDIKPPSGERLPEPTNVEQARVVEHAETSKGGHVLVAIS